jgi:hypothetical protein
MRNTDAATAPLGRAMPTAVRIACSVPTHSRTQWTPKPPVNVRTRSAASSPRSLTTSVAPNAFASAIRSGWRPRMMICSAPRRLAAMTPQVLHRAGHIFDRHVRIDAVLIEQIDGIDLEPLQRGVGDLFDALRPAVQAALLAGRRIEIETELGCNDHFTLKGSECLTHQSFVGERTIDFGGIEECNAMLDGRSDQGNSVRLVDRRPISEAQSHAAEPDGGHFKAALSQFALLHL